MFAGLFSFGWSEQSGVSLSVEKAEARIGRPLTPMSVAGVARRQNRRAGYGYGYGAAAAVGTAAAIGATAPYYTGAGYPAGSPYYSGAVRGARAAYPSDTSLRGASLQHGRSLVRVQRVG